MALKLIPMVSKCFNLVAIKNFYNEKLEKIMSIRAEYIWIDGNGGLRSKTRVHKGEAFLSEFPVWNYDGSSTGQASGNDSEVFIKPCSIDSNSNDIDTLSAL